MTPPLQRRARARAICGSRQPGLVLLLDFHPYFDQPVHVRLIKEIVQDYELRHQKLIFISHALSLPDELKSFAAAFELALPTTIELSRMVAEEAEVWAMRGDKNKVRAETASVTAMVNNLGGLTRTDARRLIRNAIRDDGAVTSSDVSAVSSARYALLGGDGLLSFEFDTAGLADIGGLQRLKHWLSERKLAFKNSQAIDKPRGLMLLGVQGGGKSLAAKAVAGAWQVPLLRLDFGALCGAGARSGGRQCLAARATGGHAATVKRHGRTGRGAACLGGGAYGGGRLKCAHGALSLPTSPNGERI